MTARQTRPKSNDRPPSRRERELLEEIDGLKRDAEMTNREYSRYYRALNGLMGDIAVFLGNEINSCTSINSGRLIAALEKASRMVHNRDGA